MLAGPSARVDTRRSASSCPRASGRKRWTPSCEASRPSRIPRSTWSSRTTAPRATRRRRWPGGRPSLGDRLVHAWQPDEGFRLARVRNLGAAAARGTYLVFIDGDCIPRRHFVAAIRRGCVPGWFLASTRLQLGETTVAHGAARRRADRELEHGGAASLAGEATSAGWRHLTPRDRRRAWRPAAPRLRSARQRLRLLHRRRPRRLRGGERVRRALRRLGRPGRRSGREARATRAALRVRGAAVGDAPSVASLERARGPSDLVAPPGDDRERPHRGARRIPRARLGAGVVGPRR